jgi:predicted NBD/HSP70 family sugar kinase
MTDPTRGSASARDSHRWFGVDVGGTKLRTAIALTNGTILAERVEPTVRDSASGLVERIADALAGLRDEARAASGRAGVTWTDEPIAAAGVAIPVGVDPVDGGLDSIHNLPGLRDAEHLQADLSGALRMPVVMDNDANAAALAERALGAARGVDDLAVVAIGTGIGVGLIAGGRLVHGARGMAGEIAFLPFGREPSSTATDYEAMVAGPGLRIRIDAAIRTDPTTSLPIGASFAQIAALAATGDALAASLVDEEAGLVAHGIGAIVALLDPEVIVLSGGVGSVPGLLEPVRRHVRALVRVAPRIETGLLGERGPLVGALELARLGLGGDRT